MPAHVATYTKKDRGYQQQQMIKRHGRVISCLKKTNNLLYIRSNNRSQNKTTGPCNDEQRTLDTQSAKIRNIAIHAA